MTAALHPAKRNSDMVIIPKYDGIQFPMRLNQIPKSEKLNALAINVYALEKIGKLKREVVSVCLSASDFQNTANLLTLHSKENNEGNNLVESDRMDTDEVKKICTPKNYHCMWIKNLSRLLRVQIANGHHRAVLCNRCLNHFKTEHSLNKLCNE